MAKGGKFLNPADKARKEARKKELKKNKKQRQQVRSEAIEKRDAEQILTELEELDRLEYESGDQQQSASVVANADLLYKEKRKRLRALLTRILEHYQKEDPERFAKLKKLETDYEFKHKKAEKDYEAIKAAKEVKIDDVILPPDPDGIAETRPAGLADIADDDPLMSETIYVTPLTEGVNPPGCPPGPPPSLKLLVEQLEVALHMPPTHLTAQHLPPKLPASYFNNKNSSHELSRAHNSNYKRPTSHQQPGSKRAKFNDANQHQAGHERNLHASKSSDNQAANRSASSGAGADASAKATNQVKKAVIESKPVIFVPRVTKFVPASVRSKIGPKAAVAKSKEHKEREKPA